jgi:hypothetical protein
MREKASTKYFIIKAEKIASMTVVCDTQITATSPSGIGTVDVTAVTPPGTSKTSSADHFTSKR